VQGKVRETFGVSLTPEVRLVGFQRSCLGLGA
jgi:UDP-N-acetylenolpyruvoylglucosamine reductase